MAVYSKFKAIGTHFFSDILANISDKEKHQSDIKPTMHEAAAMVRVGPKRHELRNIQLIQFNSTDFNLSGSCFAILLSYFYKI